MAEVSVIPNDDIHVTLTQLRRKSAAGLRRGRSCTGSLYNDIPIPSLKRGALRMKSRYQLEEELKIHLLKRGQTD